MLIAYSANRNKFAFCSSHFIRMFLTHFLNRFWGGCLIPNLLNRDTMSIKRPEIKQIHNTHTHTHNFSVSMQQCWEGWSVCFTYPLTTRMHKNRCCTSFVCVCMCVYVATCTRTYLLLHRALLHSQSPACCMRDLGLHSSWLHPCLTEIYSEEQEDTSFLFGLGLPLTFFSPLPPVLSSFSLSFSIFLLVCTSSNSYSHGKRDP